MGRSDMLRSEGSARFYTAALVCVVLLAWLTAGCGDGPPSDEHKEEPPRDKSEETAVGDLLQTLDETLVKVQSRRESFADAGNTRGARLMGEAADDVKAMQAAAGELDNGASASPEATAVTEGTTATQEQQEAIALIVENRRQLDENIEEARRCCGLPSDFLNQELRELDTEISAIQTEHGLEQDDPGETTGATQGRDTPKETTVAAHQQYDQE